MPKKYHRPPAVKRRKAKKTAVHIPYSAPPVTAEDGAAAVADEADVQAEEPAAATDVVDAGVKRAATPVRHLSRDYSYVKAEVARIVIIGGLLVVSLLLTALFRN